MKNIIEKLKEKYNLAPDSYYKSNPYVLSENQEDHRELKELCNFLEKRLQEKWHDRIVDGYYGFSFGSPTPTVWFYAIDEFLDWAQENNPDFQIFQQKLKFGQYCCYVKNINQETKRAIRQLEELLSDKFLIY